MPLLRSKQIALAWLIPVLLLDGAPETVDPVASPEPAPAEKSERSMPAEPWIGLEVAKLDEAMRAHVAVLPPGVGFVVVRVDDQGPAAAAGLRKFDILWKFDDQLLINEAQFGTLIRMRKPGEEVAMTILRAGKPELVELAIGRMPDKQSVPGLDPTEIPIYPSGVPGMPRQVVYPRDRTAEVTRHDGSVARLHYEGEEAIVHIEDASGKVIFDGPMKQDGKLAVPEEWRCTVGALLRTMHWSKDKDWHPRGPRRRVVVPPGGRADSE